MNRLKEERIKHNFKQCEIAKLVGISTTTYSYYETELREISLDTAIKLAQLYNVSLDYLFCIDSNNISFSNDEIETIKKALNILSKIKPHSNTSDKQRIYKDRKTTNSNNKIVINGNNAKINYNE